ncbi:MFS transporter [Bradyrhizobium sp.]|uniref:MFS transporter n=1 Tax=Bradyrhizobium sp. TaxID=376 RepID=UPI001EBEC478|nr:MFS transporter [Bradyrhizobium sp.]MBV9980578.1 MFS transporter [Bradyrhizobium sp.]
MAEEAASAGGARSAALARPSRFRWMVLALIFAVYTIAAADRANIGFAMPFMRKEFSMSNTQAGALLSLFLWGYALAQIPSGLAIGRFGVHRFFSWAMLLTSGFTALTGFSNSHLMLQLSRLGLGVVEAPLPIGVATTINNWFSAREKGFASGVFLSAVKFGPVIVPPICAVIVSYWSWREIFYCFAIPGVIFALLWYWLVNERPSESRFCNREELDLISDKTIVRAERGAAARRDLGLLDKLIRAEKAETLDTRAKIFGSWDIWGCSLGYAFQLGISNYMLAWIPTYLITVKKFSVAGSGLVAAAPWIGAVLGNLIGGYASDRWFDRRRKPGMIFSAVATALTMYALINSPSESIAFAALLFVTGLLFSFGFSAYMAYPMALASRETFPVASAIVNTGGQIGGACAPLAAGFILDRFGWDWVFLAMAGASLLTFLVILTVREPLT